MKPNYLIAILFAVASYFMYLLYQPFLLAMLIAGLLALSTANVQSFFEKKFKSRLYASISVTTLLAILFFAPLGYFLTALTIKLNTLDSGTLLKIEHYIRSFVTNPPSYLLFLKPYAMEFLQNFDTNYVAKDALLLAGKIGSFSAGFLKNTFMIIIFYFFAQYNASVMLEFLKRVLQISVDETALVIKELASVMSVVFYSIIATAMFEGVLFGLAISYMGYNGILFGIMYGFASLVPIIGGVIMWLPFMVYELSIGDTYNAVFIAIYSIVVISIIADTFIKPMIIGAINKQILEADATKMNELIIFFAIIAGLATFGFWGMILGPAITAFFFTILKIFEARSKEALV